MNAEIPEWIFGLTLNNNPTVSDLWNSTPAWGYPYTSSPLAPTPAAATLIDGGLAQQVAGLGAYAFWQKIRLFRVRQLPDRQRSRQRVSPGSAVQRARRRARGDQLQPVLAPRVRARLGRKFDHGRHLRHGRATSIRTI